MYKPAPLTGDSIAVPQLLFSRLCAQGAEEGRFRVALYVLANGGAEAGDIAQKLGLSPARVTAALHYWEGAGLLVNDTPTAAPPPAAPRRRLTTRQAVQAGQADPTLSALLAELQRLFGGVIGQGDVNIFVGLYAQDGFDADLILTAASEAAGRGVTRAAYVEKMLLGWRRDGIDNMAAADSYLKQQAVREAREKRLAKKWDLVWDPFTFADKKKIAQWYEEYSYGDEMIEAARLAAGEKHSDVKYLAGILKKWHAKGWRTPRDVQQSGEGLNTRATRTAAVREDPLADAADYTPMNHRRDT